MTSTSGSTDENIGFAIPINQPVPALEELSAKGRTWAKGGRVLVIQIEQAGAYTICRPVGEFDASSVARFRQALAAITSAPQLVIDLAGVPFVDSAGLGALIGAIRRVRELGGDVAVACSRPSLTRILHTTGLDRIVTVAASVDEAAVALRSPVAVRGPNRLSRHQ
jgi:anti-sigma B factor antagonist